MISSSRLAATPRQLGSSRRAKPRAFRPRKCSESGSSVMVTKGCRAFLIAGSGKPRRGATKNVAAARNNDHEKHALAGGNEPGTTRRSCGGAPPRPRPTRGDEGLTQKARKFSARNICPNLDSRSKTDLETQRTEKKAFRARADSAQSARQGGTEPGTTRFKDGRATTGPPAPRRGPGAPAVQPRPRGLDLESELKRKSQESPLQAHPL